MCLRCCRRCDAFVAANSITFLNEFIKTREREKRKKNVLYMLRPKCMCRFFALAYFCCIYLFIYIYFLVPLFSTAFSLVSFFISLYIFLCGCRISYVHIAFAFKTINQHISLGNSIWRLLFWLEIKKKCV